MQNEEPRLKIVIPVEEEPPFIPEAPKPDVKTNVRRAGQRLVIRSRKAAGKAWRSPTRKKATIGLKRGSAVVAAKGNWFVREKVLNTAGRQVKEGASAVSSRVKATDWKGEAKSGTASGLRWLSRRLERLADRFTAVETASPQPPVEPNEE